MTTTASDRFSPLPVGSSVELEGLTLALGPAADLPFPGHVREGKAPDGRCFRVLELPGEVPATLETALGVRGVVVPAARKKDGDRVLLALRPAPGPTLEWVLRRSEALSLHALSLIESLAALFTAVHEAKLCFRSVSPAMFCVGPGGAISLEDPEALRGPNEAPSRAATAFHAPEAIGGAEAGERADQFGLGALCYALLTGRIPAERGDFPLPRIFHRHLPHGATTAVQRALSPRAADRYESCRAFAADLKARTSPKGKSPATVVAAAATELGRLKGQAMPVNQDAFYFGLDSASRRGILLVADGVSTADVGSGDLAAGAIEVQVVADGRVGSERGECTSVDQQADDKTGFDR